MKLILSLFLIIPFFIISQENNELERDASFPGGYNVMTNFIKDNLEYPKIAMELDHQGKVIVQFIVNKDGTISDIEILEGVTLEIDQEAIRLIDIMPIWIPAMVDGELVTARCSLPLTFSLEGKDDIYDSPKKLARFPKGSKALNKYFKSNSLYSFVISSNPSDDSVVIEFIVNKDGTIENISLINGISEEIDNAALELVEKMPNWKPAKTHRWKVRSRVKLSLDIELD